MLLLGCLRVRLGGAFLRTGPLGRLRGGRLGGDGSPGAGSAGRLGAVEVALAAGPAEAVLGVAEVGPVVGDVAEVGDGPGTGDEPDVGVAGAVVEGAGGHTGGGGARDRPRGDRRRGNGRGERPAR